jgi:redox-sensing transcriptional repressor
VERIELPPDVVIKRLPLYARSLRHLLEEGIASVSSQELGERINYTAAQIRKDLSYFGEFGKQGIGYDVEKLLGHIERILGLTQEWPVVVMGVGPLGQAIAHYDGFRENGFQIIGLFDSDPAKVGTQVGNLTVQHIDDATLFVTTHNVKMGILAVPAVRAQGVTDMLVAAGVRALLNYAPVVVQVPPGVWVRYIDPVREFQSMTYYLAREEHPFPTATEPDQPHDV